MVTRRGCVAVLPLLLTACLSNSNPEAPDAALPLIDSGGGVDVNVPDAGAPVVTVADTGTPVDTGAPDTSLPDAGTPDTGFDAGPQPVTVIITASGAPEAGILVVFGDPTGAVISSAMTNASGAAAALVPGGSQVTAVFGDPSTPRLVTMLGVQPGDVLTADDSPPPPYLNVQVNSIPPSAPLNATNYGVAAGSCISFSGAAPWALGLSPQCMSGGTFPLLALAQDEVGNPLGFAYQKGNSANPDGGLDEAGVLEVQMEAGTWSTAYVPESVSATSVPATASGVLALSEVAGGVPTVNSMEFNGSQAPDGGPVTNQATIHGGYADFVQAELNIDLGNISDGGNANGISVTAIATRGAPSDAGVPFDYADLPPAVTSATVDATDPAHPVMSWATSGSFAAADGALTQFTWFDFNESTGANVNGSWVFILPAGATTVTGPSLPASAAAYLPSATATVQSPAVTIVDATFWTGYDQLRGSAISISASAFIQSGYGYQSIVPPLPADGTLKMSLFTYNGG